MSYCFGGLRPRYVQQEAQEHLIEHLNASWNDFCAQIIQKDVRVQVSSEFLHEVEQTKCELAALGQELRNFLADLKEHRIIAVERIFRRIAPIHRGKQKTTRF